MKKAIQLFILSFFLLSNTTGQNVVFVAGFSTEEIAARWNVTGSTFIISAAEGNLKVDYNRNSSSGQWDQFNITLDNLDLNDSPLITVEVKSDINTMLTLKPVNSNGENDWLQQSVSAGTEWVKYYFELSNSLSFPLTKIYIYLDGGSSSPVSGTVFFRNLYIGDKSGIPSDTSLLLSSISSAKLLIGNITEGDSDGEYPAGSKALIQAAMDDAEAILALGATYISQDEADIASYSLNDALMLVEAEVHYSNNPLTDSEATLPAIRLYSNLRAIANDKKYLFGMQDANSYGVGWTDNGSGDRSDVKDVCGSHPALFSFDLSHIEGIRDNKLLRNQILNAYNQGAVITFCWHQNEPLGRGFYYDNVNEEIVSKLLPGGLYHNQYLTSLANVANFTKSLRGPKGETIPIIFRPYHEHNGNWFWWGKTRCSPVDFISLWKFTFNYLKDIQNVHNFIWAYSPDGGQYNTLNDYFEIYPGDLFVDILGIDYYFGEGTTSDINRLRDKLKHMSSQANQRGKIAAITESGDRLGWNGPDNLSIPNWYTRCIHGAIKGDQEISVAYMATWRNAGTTHHFAPYPGHPAVPDFLNFYDDTSTIFLNDMLDIHNTVFTTEVSKPSQSTRMVFFTTSVSINTIISGTSIKVNIPEGTSLSDVAAIFTVAQGASVRVNGTNQVSGITANDFYSPVNYTVTAQDQVTSLDYTVQLIVVSSTYSPDTKNVAKFKIYPNPSSGTIQIDNEIYTSISIYNSYGQLERLEKDLDFGSSSLDISSLVRGIYFLRLSNKLGETAIERIIVH